MPALSEGAVAKIGDGGNANPADRKWKQPKPIWKVGR